jgi:hypothetical protein
LGENCWVFHDELVAAKSKPGDLDIKTGELYYGLEDFRRAIVALRRGLDKGQVTHGGGVRILGAIGAG